MKYSKYSPRVRAARFAKRCIDCYSAESRDNHIRRMSEAKSEMHWLIEQISMWGHITRKSLGVLILLPCLALAQQPPMPPASAELRTLIQLRQQLGKEGSHYSQPITVTVTQTVTTVYELDYMRYIRTRLSGTNGEVAMRTNWVPMISSTTNILSCVTNSSPLVPQ